MINRIVLFSLMLTMNLCNSQEEFIYGKIQDNFKQLVSNATVENQRTKISVTSSCSGEFKIEGIKNDTLLIHKDNYKQIIFLVKKPRRARAELSFDYSAIKNKIDNYEAEQLTIYQEEYNRKPLPNNSQPVFIFDGEIVFEKNEEYKESDIENVELIKGIEGFELFGKRGANGVIFVKTKCKTE
ncbi:hypothetical protein [Patiriisocius sp. Uisw_017]|jgi:hypothetical protein|uniref:hypothetical protein n=1 Tax=Patiriisocius sp. Uisw_017 TaxID=3230968 RepID=UPI0039ECB238